jgi:hypothetical protein
MAGHQGPRALEIVERAVPRGFGGPWPTVLGVCVLSAVAAAGCGKKGAPLAPIVRVPAQVESIAARRVGSDVYVTLTVPAKNIDASIPADVGRIDVYGYTGRTEPSRVRWSALGTVIGSVPVLAAPRPGVPPGPVADPSTGATQGMAVTIREPLTTEDLVQGAVDPPAPIRGRVAPAPVAAQPLPPLRRFYLAIPFSPRGRPGPPGASSSVALANIPEPPNAPGVEYSSQFVTVAWEPAGGLLAYVLDRELPVEAEPFDVVPAAVTPPMPPAYPAGPTRYSVYRDIETDPMAAPERVAPVPWQEVPAVPLGAAGTELTLQEPVEFERMRCYHLRAVRGAAPELVESDASPRVCTRPIDIYPPPPPAAPDAVAAQGSISLIWEPSSSPDIGGYVVLRGDAGDATLQPLTPAPIFDTNFRDTAVESGRRYAYAVVAVDDRVPLGNQSAPSARVEETAR